MVVERMVSVLVAWVLLMSHAVAASSESVEEGSALKVLVEPTNGASPGFLPKHVDSPAKSAEVSSEPEEECSGPKVPVESTNGVSPRSFPKRVDPLKTSAVPKISSVKTVGSSPGSAPTALARGVAVVNSELITSHDLDTAVAAMQLQFRQQNVPIPQLGDLRKQALEVLILQKALQQVTKEAGFRLDDVQLDSILVGLASNNHLTVDGLRSKIAEEGGDFEQFREHLRDELAMRRLRQQEIDKNIQVADADISAWVARRRGTMQSGGASPRVADSSQTELELRLGHILVRVPEQATPAQLAERFSRAEAALKRLQIGADFAQVAAEFSEAPEEDRDMGWRLATQYPEIFVRESQRLMVGQFSSLVRSPAGFHIVKLIDKRATHPEGDAPSGAPVQEVHLRRILISPDVIPDPAEAFRRLEALSVRISQGELDFLDVARQYADPNQPDVTGDLGWVTLEEIEPELARGATALASGEIGKPFSSSKGVELLQVLGRRENAMPSESRLRLMAQQALHEKRSQEQFKEWLQQLRDRTYVEYLSEEFQP